MRSKKEVHTMRAITKEKNLIKRDGSLRGMGLSRRMLLCEAGPKEISKKEVVQDVTHSYSRS